jgi:PKHD-type hydroxylase
LLQIYSYNGGPLSTFSRQINYIKISNENFKFDIFDVKDDNYLAYNTYSEKNKSEYGWHSDLNKGNNNHFKLTVLLNISTVNYVGGFFELFLNKPLHIKQFDKTGCMLIFPTYLQHRVTPVIQGERNTLALWLEGPRFK